MAAALSRQVRGVDSASTRLLAACPCTRLCPRAHIPPIASDPDRYRRHHTTASGRRSPASPLRRAERTAVLSDAEGPATRGHLDLEIVLDIRKRQGNLDIANSALMSASWSKIESKTVATVDEVRRVGDLGPLLIAALGVLQHGTTGTPAEAATVRSPPCARFRSGSAEVSAARYL